MEDRTAEQLASDFSAMGDSISLVEGIIAGSQMADQSATERQDCVDRNTQHLELMVAKTDWTSQDMTAAEDAIFEGNSYVAV
tara:strand:- start:416 stop:661 length:246 start_codon:yes stop_codon:yes gene_type:complete